MLKVRSSLIGTIALGLLCLSPLSKQLHGQLESPSKVEPSSQLNATTYDPLKVDASQSVETILFEFAYSPTTSLLRRGATTGESRTVPVKVYLPTNQRAPVVLFSHGLGGSREGFKHGGEHWARRGYIAVFLQHPGSDDSVWRDKAMGQRMASAREAANAQNLILRMEDVKAAIDCLEKVEQGDAAAPTAAQPLRSRLDLAHLGMSGHSFGAITTQMVSGQSSILPAQKLTDSRIRAALILSPSTPKLGQPERTFSQVNIPWMLMTGTKDDSPIGDQSAESRLNVFPALPAGQKYQVVFDGGTHAFLGERIRVLGPKEESNSHARCTLALSTAFWDTYLSNNSQARQWLDGDGPRRLLAPADQWQVK